MQTKIVAHRGDTKKHPENTLSAFAAALSNGADGVELDVHMTSDGELIIHHDYYLGNPDNGEGRIYEKNLAYIQSLHIGDSEHIPSLEEVFQLIGNKLHYEIEIKGFTEEVVSRVIELVKKYQLADKVEFTSPHAYVLMRLKALETRLTVGRFIAPLPNWMDKQLGQTLAINEALLGKIGVLHCPLSMIDAEFIELAHEQELAIHAADCNTKAEFETALALGVDQLSTNELERALAVRIAQKHA